MRLPPLPSRRLVVATALVASLASVAVALSEPASLTVDGQRIVSDVPPVTDSKHAFVPLRAIAEGLGGDARFDAKTGTVELVRGSDVLRMHVGDHRATLNGNPMTLRHPPFAVRGRVMIGLGVIARAFGSKVKYDAARAHIDVITPGVVEAGAAQEEP
ncbi:MAG: copper amine oxidase N-terminal domain-containing protein [Candidatus Baltobacteraceae bacterium]